MRNTTEKSYPPPIPLSSAEEKIFMAWAAKQGVKVRNKTKSEIVAMFVGGWKNAPPEAYALLSKHQTNSNLRPQAKPAAILKAKKDQEMVTSALAPKSSKPAIRSTPARKSGLTAIDRALFYCKSFQGDSAAQKAMDVDAELKVRFGKVLGERNFQAERHLESRGIDVKAIATEGNPTSGGYATPTPLSDVVLEQRSKLGVSRQVAMVFPVKSDMNTVGKVTSDQTVYYPNESMAATPSDIVVGQVAFAPKKRAVLSYYSAELFTDASIAFANLLVSRATHALATREDRELIHGDGSDTWGDVVGLVNAIGAGGIHTAASGHDTHLELDLPDFAATMAKLPEQWADGREVWLMTAAFYYGTALRACGAYQGFDESGRPLLLGRPVFFVPSMPTEAASTICAFFGNLQEAIAIGDRISFALGISDHAQFASDNWCVRAISRYDLVCHEAGTASTAGAVVASRTAA